MVLDEALTLKKTDEDLVDVKMGIWTQGLIFYSQPEAIQVLFIICWYCKVMRKIFHCDWLWKHLKSPEKASSAQT